VIAVLGALVAIFTADLNTVAEKQMAIAGIPILLLLFALVGAAGEYRHRTAAPAALVARDRGGLLAGRAAAYVLTGLAIAALGMVVTLAVGLPLLGNEPGTALGAGDVGVVVAGSLIAAALFAIMGVAVGTLLRSSWTRSSAPSTSQSSTTARSAPPSRLPAQGAARACPGAGPRWCWPRGRCRS
jgi:hypothetical protein